MKLGGCVCGSWIVFRYRCAVLLKENQLIISLSQATYLTEVTFIEIIGHSCVLSVDFHFRLDEGLDSPLNQFYLATLC